MCVCARVRVRRSKELNAQLANFQHRCHHPFSRTSPRTVPLYRFMASTSSSVVLPGSRGWEGVQLLGLNADMSRSVTKPLSWGAGVQVGASVQNCVLGLG